ncbi:DUF6924 domain-containing protein [Catenuloplanes atrovinosus]|uniref:DUF6924 domain-containing protein n=1 Tax=Catenuloplanes atrovinosus TaxID=137266 RepID=A0AAE3YQK8_9ACTN|nr:hypothetical protein [Catenuloplanes atrovinosus]MDR7275976.1 hypothetical protein [Catenuloplanes atrovinosus]
MTLPIPPDAQGLLLRTDFTDDAAWDTFRKTLQRHLDDYRASMLFVDDRAHAGLTPGGLVRLAEGDEDLAFAFLADEEAINDPEHPVIAVDLADEPGRAFRVVASELFSVQTNLDLATTDFADFARMAGRDGVYRGGA